MGSYRKMMMMVMAALMVSLAAAQAQTPPDMSCIQALIPCAPALNSTDAPPQSCCEPLSDVIETQLPCLCAVFKNTELAASANVNITQALQLPARCGIDVDPSMCEGGQAVSPASAPVAGGPTKPPRVASTPTATPGSNASSSIALTGSYSSFMLVLAGWMFY